VGQRRQAEHQGQRERHEVELGGVVLAVGAARFQEALAQRALLGRGREQVREAEAVLAEQEHRDQHHGQHQHAGLDDLHPRGALHPADQDVQDHDQADHADHERLPEPGVDVEQQGDQAAGARHLREHVEEGNHQGRRRRRGPDSPRFHPEADDVAHREPAGVAGQLGDQQQVDQPGDQEADRVEEAVVPVDGDRARDAEERRGRQEVPGERDAVLAAGEGAARGVVVRRRGAPAAGPVDDVQRDRHEEGEHDCVDDRVAGGRPVRGEGAHRRRSSGTPARARSSATRGSSRRRA
jgi:hypothetical protein